jgi:hypothetical protein
MRDVPWHPFLKLRNMYKVRIKTSPSENDKGTGQQDAYGLVRNLNAMQSAPQQVSVNNKMGAVPRDQANIEVEGGESVIGDVNKDGTMELMHFVGKRHSEGGVPVNIPEGSFIYSDTKSLTIKDKEVIEKLFNLPFRKQGYTPAEISKKYEINQYVEILKDETTDAIAKRSAAEMLKKNKEKLGILAFIQESMKGFPDGIPAIAEEVLATLGIDPNQLIEQAAPQPAPQGIPMGEDEDAMAGMIPQGPEASMDDLANQMPQGEMPMGRNGGELPSYALAGNVVPNKYWETLSDKEKGVLYRIAESGYSDITPMDNGRFYYRDAPGAKEFNQVSFSDWDAIKPLYDQGPKRPAQTTSLKSGKIYTYEARPGTYYKVDKNGKVLVKNENTGWQYTEMNDPTGNRVKTLEAGLKSGNTKEFKKQSEVIPYFGSKSEMNAFMQQGAEQQVAATTFYDAIKSGDPKLMLSAAEEIKSIDVPWSVGWLPWTDQDSIDDMYTVLQQEALKKLNQSQKKVITDVYAKDKVEGKVKDLVNLYEKRLEKASSVKEKLELTKKLQEYKNFQDYVQNDYEGYLKSVRSSNVKRDESIGSLDTPFGSYDLGNPIQDVDFLQRGNWLGKNLGEDGSLMSMLEKVYTAHDRLKGTNEAKQNPLAFKGQFTNSGGRGDNISFYGDITSFDRDPNEVKNVAKKIYGEKTSIKDSKYYKPEYRIGSKPNSIFVVDTDADGSARWFERAYDGSEMVVSDIDVVSELNKKATIAENKTFAIKPASSTEGTIIEQLEQQQNIQGQQPQTNPQRQQQRQSVVSPIGRQQAPAPNPSLGGLSEDAFNFEEGGSVNINGRMFRYGGSIDAMGKLEYAKGGLVKYVDAGTVTEPEEKGPPQEELVGETTTKVNGTDVRIKQYKMTFADGTVYNVVRRADDNSLISRKNMSTGETDNDATRMITRGSTEYVTKDNLNEWDRQQMANKWNGRETDYLNYINARNQILTNKEFRSDLKKQFDQDIENVEAYTGQNAQTKQRFKDQYYSGLKGMDEQAMMEQLLAQEERNARLAAYGLDAYSTEQNADIGSGKTTNKKTWEFIQNTPGLNDLYTSNAWNEGEKGQAAYISYRRMLANDPKYKAQNLAEFQVGQGDETIFGVQGRISGIDRYSTNTTLGQRLGWKPSPPPPITIPGEKEAYYCVEFSDGTSQVQTVGYKEGEQPVAPSGGKITKATQHPDRATADANCKKTPIIPPGDTPGPKDQPWFAPDIVNYQAAIRQEIPSVPPTLRQMQQAPSGYDTFNPITQIAGVTGAAKQYNDLLMNTMDPTVAAAVGANFGFDDLAKRITEVEGSNLGVTNANYDKIAQRAMQVDQFNTQSRRQFDVDNAVYQEELARDINKKNAQEALLWGTGWKNASNDDALRIQYPNAQHVNRISGNYDWSGVGRDPLGPDTYVSPVAGGSGGGGGEDCLGIYESEKAAAVKRGLGAEEAKSHAEAMRQSCIQRNNYAYTQKGKSKTPQAGYNQGVAGIYGNYSAPGSRQFGGVFFDDENY